MAKHKENRKIPDLIIDKNNDNTPFESFDDLETENYTCFGVTQKDTHALSLKILVNDGGVILMRYSGMLSNITYNGKGKIVIMTVSLKLEINGRHLLPLMNYLGAQRLAWIKNAALDSASDSLMMKTGEPEISTILLIPIKAEKKS